MKSNVIFLFFLLIIQPIFCIEQKPKFNRTLKWEKNWCWMDSALQVLARSGPMADKLATWYQKYSRRVLEGKDFETEYGINLEKEEQEALMSGQKYYYTKQSAGPEEILGQLSILMHKIQQPFQLGEREAPVNPRRFYDSLFPLFTSSSTHVGGLRPLEYGRVWSSARFLNMLFKKVLLEVSELDFSEMYKNVYAIKQVQGEKIIYDTGVLRASITKMQIVDGKQSHIPIDKTLAELITSSRPGRILSGVFYGLILPPKLFIDLANNKFLKFKIPLELNISKTLMPSTPKSTYQLSGAIFGSRGHYVALVKQSFGEWYFYSDSYKKRYPKLNSTKSSEQELLNELNTIFKTGTIDNSFFVQTLFYEEVFDPKTITTSAIGEKINRMIYAEGPWNAAASVLQVLAEYNLFDAIVKYSQTKLNQKITTRRSNPGELTLTDQIAALNRFTGEKELYNLIKLVTNQASLDEARRFEFWVPVRSFLEKWVGYQGNDATDFFKSLMELGVEALGEDDPFFKFFTTRVQRSTATSYLKFVWEAIQFPIQNSLLSKMAREIPQNDLAKLLVLNVGSKEDGVLPEFLELPHTTDKNKKLHYELFGIVGINERIGSFNASVKKKTGDWYFYSHLFQKVQKYTKEETKKLLTKNSGFYNSRAHLLFYRQVDPLKHTTDQTGAKQADVTAIATLKSSIERLKQKLLQLQKSFKKLAGHGGV